MLLRTRLRERARANPDAPSLDDDYLRELNEAYNHFFFHYTATPLLVVETSQFDRSWGDEALDDLVKQLQRHGPRARATTCRGRSSRSEVGSWHELGTVTVATTVRPRSTSF